MDIVNRIKNVIKLRKMNQRELADLTGYSTAAINKALARGDFKVSMLEKFAKVLDVPMNFFFEEGDNLEIKGKNNIQLNFGNGDNSRKTDSIHKYETDLLKEKIIGLEKEIALLKQINEMLMKQVNK